jgi:integrase-like protein
MARPRLEIGTWGKIGFVHQNGIVRAYANYRFNDGTIAKRERSGKDEDEAARNLVKYLRSLNGVDDLTRTATVQQLADQWIAQLHEQEKVTTYKRYASCARNHVLPAIGGLRIH